MKDVLTGEYEPWRKENLSHSRYAYIWADGVCFSARVEGERNCMLVVVGTTFKPQKKPPDRRSIISARAAATSIRMQLEPVREGCVFKNGELVTKGLAA